MHLKHQRAHSICLASSIESTSLRITKKKGPGFFRDHIICILYSACHAFSTFHTLPHNHCFCRFCNLFGALFASQNIQKLAANRKRSFKKPPPLSPSVITTKSRRKVQKVDTLGRLTAPRDVLLLLLCPTAPQRNIQKLAANRKHSFKKLPPASPSVTTAKSLQKVPKIDTLGRLTAPRDVLLLLFCPAAPS